MEYVSANSTMASLSAVSATDVIIGEWLESRRLCASVCALDNGTIVGVASYTVIHIYIFKIIKSNQI